MKWFSRKGPSGFSSSSTAEEVTAGVDGRGLVAVITGASSGIGLETARVLALRGVHVVMAVRNVAAGHAAKEGILAKIPGAKVDVLELDLSSMASVRSFASKFESLNLPVNILINNGGVFAKDHALSCDGLELNFATNHLGHFLLTSLLLDNMKSACRDSGVEGRIVNLASALHTMAPPEGINFDKLRDPSGLNGYVLYGQSKLANILHTNELSQILKEEGVNISANSLHPGLVATGIFRNRSFAKGLLNWIGGIFLKTVEQGAATTCYVAMHPGAQGISGKYFDSCNLANPSSQASDAELAKKLWQYSLKTVSS